MKAISIRQPWAWLILHAGKDIENRDWNERYPARHEARRLIGHKILIHAAKGMTKAEYEDGIDTWFAVDPRTNLVQPSFESLERGGIVGEAVLFRVVMAHTSPWFFGPIGLVLHRVKPVPFFPCRGALGFFDVVLPEPSDPLTLPAHVEGTE